jgi:hypothetical protein
VLSTKPLGDPAERDLLVYLPPGYERSGGQRYPVVFALAGYSESDAALQNWLVLATWDICLENVLIENTSPSLLVRKHEISIQSEGSTMLFCSAYSVPC